jgi:hypothetical protein
MTMSRLLLTEPVKAPMQQTHYHLGLFWILRERAGSGGWPPRDIDKVSGWLVVRMLAYMSARSPREVAADLIEHATVMGEP